jgi:citrate synthase
MSEVRAAAHAWEEHGSGLRIKGPIPRPLPPTYTGPEPRDPKAAPSEREI